MDYEKRYDAVTHRGEGSLETRSHALDRSHYVWCAGGRAPAIGHAPGKVCTLPLFLLVDRRAAAALFLSGEMLWATKTDTVRGGWWRRRCYCCKKKKN